MIARHSFAMVLSWVLLAQAATEANARQVTPGAEQDLEGVYVQVVGSPSGFRSFLSSRWGLVSVVAENETDQPQRVSTSVSVDGADEIRFSREVLVPANSLRMTTIPVHLPSGRPAGKAAQFSGHVAGENLSAAAKRNYLASVIDQTGTAFIEDRPIVDLGGQIGRDYPYEAAIAVREAIGRTRTLAMIEERMLPTTVEGWDSIDSVIIAGNRLENEPAARQAIRQWLAEGGRLWIQADLMGFDTIRKLFGGAITIEEIDRVLLNNFQLKVGNPDTKSVPTDLSLENPVQFVRTLVDGVEVIYQIDGWPAMVRFKFGRGEVYMTMLEGRGWIRRRNGDDKPYSDPKFYTDFVALPPLQDLAVGLRERDTDEVIPKQVQAEYVNNQIGYKIPDGSFVIGVLVGFCSLIGVAAVVLSVIGYREHLLWVTMGTAGLASIIVVSSGLSSRGKVPTTAASFQIVNVLPQMNEAVVSGTVGFYQSTLAPASVSSEDKTRMNPQSVQLAGKIRDFVWNDAIHWRWNDTALPASVQLFDFNRNTILRRPVTAIAQFGPSGLSGTVDAQGLLTGLLQDEGGEPLENASVKLVDCIVVFPKAPPLAARLEEGGRFTASIEDTLPPGEFFGSTFVDSTQRNRRAIYQAWYDFYLLKSLQDPCLVGWTESVGTGLKWGPEVKRIDGSLVVIPLKLTDTPSESKVIIPGSAIVAVSEGSSVGRSATFDSVNQRWLHPFTRASKTRLRFQLPKQVIPLDISEAVLSIDCNMPSRNLKIEAIETSNSIEQRRTIVDRSNVSGKMEFDLVGDQSLKLDQGDGIVLEFIVSDPTTSADRDQLSISNWSIRSTHVHVTGTTSPITKVESP